MKYFLIFLFVLLPITAIAQAPPECALPFTNPVNPTTVCFIAPADHDSLTGYMLDIIDPLGNMLQSIDMGKPAIDVNGWVMWEELNIMPKVYGRNYTSIVRAVVGAISSTPSLPSNAWDSLPLEPVDVRTVN